MKKLLALTLVLTMTAAMSKEFADFKQYLMKQ